ncbi:uncharacterized protein [Prorops nasuta]|uniref:uncharacterized protein n=1 Tax=Prorops nasuta TaxID=863751 RepID=UPI0034CEEB46
MSAINFKSLDENSIKKFLESFDTVLTDCDGVLWIQMKPILNASETLNAFRNIGKQVYYVTNSSGRSKEQFMKKCKLLNFEVIGDDVICTPYLAACYLRDIGFSKKVYVIGSEAITKELDKVGITSIGVGPDPVKQNDSVSYQQFEKDPDVGAVIVGFDEHFSYPKMIKAATYLYDPNVLFIGTNTDCRVLIPNSFVFPGTGSLVRCIEACSQRKATIVGKPDRYISDVLLKHLKIKPERTLIIGDRCETDVLLGTRCGFKTMLVLSGETKLQTLEKYKQSSQPEHKGFIPNFYIDSLSDLLEYLQKYKRSQKINSTKQNYTMAMKKLLSLPKEEFRNFIDSIDVVLSDCDGVLWRETEVIGQSPEAVEKLKQLGKKFFYVTNNNSKTRAEFLKKCEGMRYKASMDELVCTSFLAAVYLKELKFTKKAYVIGAEGIAKELAQFNIESCGTGPDPMEGDEVEFIKNFKPDPDVGAVVVGFDKHFSYPKLIKAATYLKDPDVHFVGTNCDTERPSPNSNQFPGTGCFVNIIESASGRKAVMMGKPEKFLSEYIIKSFGIDPVRTLMIGDNCKTDILLGKRCGFKTLLVLSGVTSEADVETMRSNNTKEENNATPDYYTDQLEDVIKMF